MNLHIDKDAVKQAELLAAFLIGIVLAVFLGWAGSWLNILPQ